MDFKWLPGKVGTPVIVQPPPPTPEAPPPPPITGVIVPPIVDISLRGVHSTWEAALAALVVTVVFPLFGVHLPAGAALALTGVLTGLAAVGRSFLAHKVVAKAAPAVKH
jgi:hypothetical protein